MILKKILWVIGWIVFFPIPLTILIYKSKLNSTIKLFILLILWSFTILFLITPSEPITNKDNNSEIEKTDTNKEINDSNINENNEDNNKENNKKDNKKDNKENKKEIKTYKLNSEEYFNYVVSVMESITKKNDTYTKFNSHTYGYIYIVVSIYPNRILSNDEFEKYLNDISVEIFKELKKNKYKSGGFFATDYEIINVDFYNYDEHYPHNPSRERTKQFYVLELKDYDTYEEYDSRNDY